MLFFKKNKSVFCVVNRNGVEKSKKWLDSGEQKFLNFTLSNFGNHETQTRKEKPSKVFVA